MTTDSFLALGLCDKILTVLQELKFETLTPIQTQSLPHLLAGEDLIGQSKTGSGKTAAFALPILQKIQLQERCLQALILCPTRELSTQVAKEIRKLGRRFEGLSVVVLCGGEPVRGQAESLENGAHIAVGTPGRILDLMQKRKIYLDQMSTLVMDEADKMLEMGFEEEIKIIMDIVPQERQTVFFSATYPEFIQQLSQQYQKNPVRVTISSEQEEAPLIEEFLYDVQDEVKTSILMRVLQQHPADSTLVFCNQKATVDEIAQMINGKGVSCAALHGDLEQRDRERVMAMFRNGSHRILVATDVAARGLDIDHLDLVINFDLPLQPENYVHRIGRTGRAGRKGVSVTLARHTDEMKIHEIEKYTKRRLQRPKLGYKNQNGLSSAHGQALMQTISIAGGRKDKLRPGDILGALTGSQGALKAADVGKIEIMDRLSFVAISSSMVNVALQKLRDGKIKGSKFQVKLVKDKITEAQ